MSGGAEQPNLPPVTEEDKPVVEQMIQRLVRLRKRQTAHNSDTNYLTDAIDALQSFGQIKGWWT